MKIDIYQREYIRELMNSQASPAEVLELIKEIIEREQERKSITHAQYLRLQDLRSLVMQCSERAKEGESK